jgi:hypothetical protein
MNNDLVPEHRTDKNGVLSTKWVRPAQFTDAVSVSFPVPAITDPQNEIKRLSDDIIRSYKAAGFGENFARINERAVQRVVDTGNLSLLAAIAKVTADKPMSVNQIISHLEEMRDAGIDNPESQITAARITSYNKVWSVLNDLDAKDRMSGGNWEVLQLILVADDDDRDVLEDIVVKRGATSHDEVLAMFTLLKGTEQPLAAGTL